MTDQICLRCGFRWEVSATRKTADLCQSCRARKQQKIADCLPWHGSYDVDLVTPIDEDGLEVMPGRRSCGNADCVSGNHVRAYK